MRISTIFLLIFGFLGANFSRAGELKDSSLFIPLIGMSYAYQIPAGDMAKRFGNNSNLGLTFLIKTKKNWIIGLNSSFLFGKAVKETSILSNISAGEDNILIDNEGHLAEIRLYERGFTGSLRLGKLFTIGKKNKNSGILLVGDIGFLQHKIRIESIGNKTPQLDGEFKKGYDRLCNGLLFSEFLGYQHLSNNRLTNFFIGFEFNQGLTQNRRSLDYDLMTRNTDKRLDMYYGIRAGWILPLYKRVPDAFYYF